MSKSASVIEMLGNGQTSRNANGALIVMCNATSMSPDMAMACAVWRTGRQESVGFGRGGAHV